MKVSNKQIRLAASLLSYLEACSKTGSSADVTTMVDLTSAILSPKPQVKQIAEQHHKVIERLEQSDAYGAGVSMSDLFENEVLNP